MNQSQLFFKLFNFQLLMRQSFSISFVCRESKANKSGLAPIEMSISVNGERVFVTLPYRCEPKSFRKAMNSRKVGEIKAFTNSVYANVQSKVAELVSVGVSVSAESIKRAYLGDGRSIVYKVSDLFGDYLDLQKGRVGKSLSMSVWRKYQIVGELFVSVNGDMNVCDIRNCHIVAYQNRVVSLYKESTVQGMMRKLKTVVKFGIDNKKMVDDPFVGIKIKAVRSMAEIITVEEYERIRDRRFSCERLEKVRKLFVLACNCGLSYSDIVSLRKEDFIDKGDGRYIIHKRRVKTNVEYTSVILKDGIDIVREFDFDLSELFISNQRLNSYLKEVADLCGVVSVPSLHFHIARHYYATCLVRNGVSLAVVQRCVGHASIKMTIGTYTHLVDDDILKGVASCF